MAVLASKQMTWLHFLDVKACPRNRMSDAMRMPSRAPTTGSPPSPIGCSIRAPIRYPINAVRSIPIIARINEALTGASNGLLTNDSLI